MFLPRSILSAAILTGASKLTPSGVRVRAILPRFAGMGGCLRTEILVGRGDDVALMHATAHGALDMDHLAVERIATGCEHQGRVRRGCGCEDLYLLRCNLQLLRGKAPQLVHVLLGAAGMGSDEVVGEELPMASQITFVIELLLEVDVALGSALAHQVQHVGAGVFRCQLELSRDMMRGQ